MFSNLCKCTTNENSNSLYNISPNKIDRTHTFITSMCLAVTNKLPIIITSNVFYIQKNKVKNSLHTPFLNNFTAFVYLLQICLPLKIIYEHCSKSVSIQLNNWKQKNFTHNSK